MAISRWLDGSSRSIRSGLSSRSLASIIRDCWPPENVARRPVKFRLGEAEARQHLLDAVIDRVSILVLELAVKLVVAPPGPLAVGRVFRLGHLLGGLLELVLQLDQRGEPRLDDLHQRFAGLEVDLLPQQADPDSRAARTASRNRAVPGRPGA